MTKTLEQAIAAIRTLPEPVQERIGARILVDADRYSQLQRELEQAEAEMEEGKGIPMSEVIETLKQRYGGGWCTNQTIEEPTNYCRSIEQARIVVEGA